VDDVRRWNPNLEDQLSQTIPLGNYRSLLGRLQKVGYINEENC
jgi:hypothetical protein